MITTTLKNERRLQRVLKIVKSTTNFTPELKLACQQCINQAISDVQEKHITSYHDLIDYLREKANQGIDSAGFLTSEQKVYLKSWTYICAEIAKLRRCNKTIFWPGKTHGRIKAS